jgi:hypothetical protein
MIEAIGHQYLDTYFGKVSSLLEDDGMALIQAITVEDHQVVVSIPQDKIQAILSSLQELSSATIAPRRQFRVLAGKINFVAGLVPVLRPFLAPLWKACSQSIRKPRKRSASRALPKHLVHVHRFREDLAWLSAFFPEQRGSLRRTYYAAPEQSPVLHVVGDASPWGMGAILLEDNVPSAFFAVPVDDVDLARFRATAGDSKFLTYWEALCLLIAMRLWRPPQCAAVRFCIKSDSLGALLALRKGASSAEPLNLILREVALEEAELSSRIECATHIPGLSNTIADALSRRYAPDPSPLPVELSGARQDSPPVRNRAWYRSLGAPVREGERKALCPEKILPVVPTLLPGSIAMLY